MDYDFETSSEALRIPLSAYKSVKRCRYCRSVFIDEKICESCGRSMLFHPVGEPFGAKSFYGIKERYVESFPAFLRFFPQFENSESPEAKSYVRKLSKRFSDLIAAFNTPLMIPSEERKFFYGECIELIDEMLRYKTDTQVIYSFLEENDSSLIGQELMLYLQEATGLIVPPIPWTEASMKHLIGGGLRVEFALKALIITATASTMAVVLKDLISSQFGK